MSTLQTFVQPRLWLGDEHQTCFCLCVILATYWLREKNLSAESDKPWSWHKGRKLPDRETRMAELEQPTGKLSFSFHRSQQVTEL